MYTCVIYHQVSDIQQKHQLAMKQLMEECTSRQSESHIAQLKSQLATQQVSIPDTSILHGWTKGYSCIVTAIVYQGSYRTNPNIAVFGCMKLIYSNRVIISTSSQQIG